MEFVKNIKCIAI